MGRLAGTSLQAARDTSTQVPACTGEATHRASRVLLVRQRVQECEEKEHGELVQSDGEPDAESNGEHREWERHEGWECGGSGSGGGEGGRGGEGFGEVGYV